MTERVTVVGAGLAGCEAAWQLAENSIPVRLCEMKPEKKTPAHVSDNFAELVCSNSLRSGEITNAVGLLKEEMRRFGSLVMRSADKNRVSAGSALAVDREGFARDITELIRCHPLIEISSGEVLSVPDGRVIIATGPLSSDGFNEAFLKLLPDKELLRFFDAAAPIVTADSIDMESAFFASRYDKGTPDYINCPMEKDEYLAFHDALCRAEEAKIHGFEDGFVFEGCMPVEVMARRGEDTLRYGPLKPVGLRNPKTGREAYAVVQLRRDNRAGTVYNMVGFQTHLKFSEQKRVFSMIPALKNAEFTRFGVMHKNTFINSPKLLDRYYRLKTQPRIAFAGQITGVEGYVESAASGLYCALECSRELMNKAPLDLTAKTALGALALYISNESIGDFQPMNINFGIIEPLSYRVRGKRNKNAELAKRSIEEIERINNDK